MVTFLDLAWSVRTKKSACDIGIPIVSCQRGWDREMRAFGIYFGGRSKL